MNVLSPRRSNGEPSTARRGQTLVEFAISLPLLLLLLFGIIEFGRLFQSWVTLQNAARTAARYTITGTYNEQKYDLETLLPCVVSPQSYTRSTYLAPVFQEPGAPQNPFFTYVNDQAHNSIDILVPTGSVPESENEAFFNTWYGLEDCFPDDENLQRRRDMLRLPSIYDAARLGATGLLLEPPVTGEGTREDFENYFRSVWSNPSLRYDDRAWFDVSVCSARERIWANDVSEIVDNYDDPNSLSPATVGMASLRFQTAVDDPRYPYPYGACILKERPRDDSDAMEIAGRLPNNYDMPWMDAGGAGDRVTITVTYNHPLITPLGLAEYVRMQARRSAVNESFRTTNAERALGPSGFVLPPNEEPPPPDSSGTPAAPDTATPLPTLGPPPTATFTSTPMPFSCDLLSARNVTFDRNRFFIQFSNENAQSTIMTASRVVWNQTKLHVDYPGAYLGRKIINNAEANDIYWFGEDTTSPTDSRSEGTFLTSANRNIPGNDSVVSWEGFFVNGPQALVTVLSQWDFDGTEFWFDHPTEALDCRIVLELPPPPPGPTEPPPGFVPSATFTPDCASSTLRVRFDGFVSLGDVRLVVENNRPVVAPMTNFNIVWRQVPGVSLIKVVAGGSNANDLVDAGGQGVVVWQNLSGGANVPPVNGQDTSKGTWVTNYTFPPNSQTFIHLDFTGVGNGTLASAGLLSSDFNGTQFTIGCGSTGVGGTGGGGSSGDIFLSTVEPPGPTSTLPPSFTPGATLTASRTPTPRPPTLTFTPRPPTNTPLPSATARATNTFTPSPTPTDIDRGGADG